MRKIAKKFLGHLILSTLLLTFLISEVRISAATVLTAVAISIPLSIFLTYSEFSYFRASFTPMQVRVKQKAREKPENEIQTEFTSGNSFSLCLSIAIVGFLFILFAVVVHFRKPYSGSYYRLYGIILMICYSMDMIHGSFGRLTVSTEGITCRFPLYQVQVKWGEINQIEHRGRRGWFISCHSSEVKAFFIVAGCLKFFEEDRIIRLERFTRAFEKSQLLESIHFFAPAMRYVTSE